MDATPQQQPPPPPKTLVYGGVGYFSYKPPAVRGQPGTLAPIEPTPKQMASDRAYYARQQQDRPAAVAAASSPSLWWETEMARARANAARPDNSPAANAMYELFGVDPASVALQDELDTLRRAAGIAKPPPLKVTWTTVDCSANDNNDEEECGGDDDDGSHL